MSHKVETMTYHGTTPWHGLGTRLADDELYNTEAGIIRAGLNWSVELEQLQLADGRAVDRFAVVRSNDRSILGTVGPKYMPLQNVEAFKFFDPFLEAKAAKLHTAGSLDHGRVVWVLCHVSGSQAEVVKGDRVDQFILLSSSHDGSQAVRVGFTPIRVVCANTLAMAHSRSDAASKLIRVRHTRSMHDNLEAIRDVMDVARREFAATLEQYRKLACTHINQKDVRKYIKVILGVKEGLPLDEIAARTRNTMFALEQLTEKATGSNIPGVAGTWWNTYNAVSEWLSYGRGGNAEKRLNNLWFGSAVDLNQRALATALEMAS